MPAPPAACIVYVIERLFLGLNWFVRFCHLFTRHNLITKFFLFVQWLIAYIARPFVGTYANDPRIPAYQMNSLMDVNFSIASPIDPVRVCVMAAKLAYESLPVVERVIQDWPQEFTYITPPEVVNTDKNVDTQFFLCYWGEDVIVSFRGTEGLSITDWVTTDFNMEIERTPELGGMHAGFLEALGLSAHSPSEASLYRVICDRIDRAFEQRSSKYEGPKTVYVTGHSLGAALALVFGAHLIKQEEKKEAKGYNVSILTFGQPRVGDLDFNKVMLESLRNKEKFSLLRFVNNNDLIPRVPSAKQMGFAHVRNTGGSWYIYCNGNTVELLGDEIENPPIEWMTPLRKISKFASEPFVRVCLRLVSLALSPAFLFYGNFLDDHLPGDYERGLRPFHFPRA